MFSIYLSSDSKSPANIQFGGYDLAKYAKNNHQIVWTEQSSNNQYWATNTKKVHYGKFKIAKNNQQVIFDNGMTQTMAPEKSFVELVKAFNAHGFKCEFDLPLWTCQGKDNSPSYGKLTEIEFDLLLNKEGQIKKVKMPPPAYMKYDDASKRFKLFITPW